MKKIHSSTGSEGSETARLAKTHRWRSFTIVVVVIAVLLVIGRLLLPTVIRDYVNRTLDKSQLYRGKIGDVQVHLWRGAYSIHNITISKVTGDVPVPLFSGAVVDFSIQWRA